MTQKEFAAKREEEGKLFSRLSQVKHDLAKVDRRYKYGATFTENGTKVCSFNKQQMQELLPLIKVIMQREIVELRGILGIKEEESVEKES